MQRSYRSMALAVAWATLAAGLSTCGGSGGGTGMGFSQASGATFEVLGSIPSGGAVGVGLGTQVQVRFEHPVNPVSITPASFSVWTHERVAGDVQVAGDTVLFSALEPLAVSAVHTIRLTDDIRSSAGESLAADLEIPFQTRDGQWGTPLDLPASATLADLAGTAAGEMLALRLRTSSPWSDLVVTRLTPAATAWESDTELFVDGSVAFARLALDGSGWGLALANRNIGGNTYAIWAAQRAADGSWSAPLEVAPLDSGFTQPEVAVVAAGRALVAWRRNATGEVWARTLDVASGWSSPVRLSAPGSPADAPVVAADGQGAAIVVWREDSRRLRAARYDGTGYSGTGGWGAVGELVHDNFTCCVSEPLASLAPGAPPVVAWHADGALFASRFASQTGTWTSAEIINGAGCAGALQRPAVATDASGRVFATWVCDEDVWASWSEEGEPWIDPLALDGSGSASDPRVALDGNGNATLVWTRLSTPGGTRRLLSRRRNHLGQWTAEVQVSDPAFCAVAPRLVCLPDGGLHSAWTVTVGCDFSQGTGSRAARFE